MNEKYEQQAQQDESTDVDIALREMSEPVAWTWDTKNQRDGFLDAHFQFSKPESHSLIMNLRPLYAEPPKRDWIGLTPEERFKIWEISDLKDPFSFAVGVEIKLKELNA